MRHLSPAKCVTVLNRKVIYSSDSVAGGSQQGGRSRGRGVLVRVTAADAHGEPEPQGGELVPWRGQSREVREGTALQQKGRGIPPLCSSAVSSLPASGSRLRAGWGGGRGRGLGDPPSHALTVAQTLPPLSSRHGASAQVVEDTPGHWQGSGYRLSPRGRLRVRRKQHEMAKIFSQTGSLRQMRETRCKEFTVKPSPGTAGWLPSTSPQS